MGPPGGGFTGPGMKGRQVTRCWEGCWPGGETGAEAGGLDRGTCEVIEGRRPFEMRVLGSGARPGLQILKCERLLERETA